MDVTQIMHGARACFQVFTHQARFEARIHSRHIGYDRALHYEMLL